MSTTVALANVENVRAELQSLEASETSPLRKLWYLAISLFLFISWGLLSRDPREIGMLVGVLLFHEMGHFVAMKLFGYRNVSMFFIPFFGAAVSGSSRRMAAWKATVVALAGPAPGIVLGAAALIAWLAEAGGPWLREACWILIFINAFNLLPLLPLDGGHVLKILLARQHTWLEVVYTILTGALLGLMGLGLGSVIFMILGGLIIFSAPTVLATARLAEDLNGLLAPSDPARDKDLLELSDEQLEPIVARLRAALPANQPLKLAARRLNEAWDRFGVESAGCLSAVVLLGLHGLLFFGSLIIMLILGVQKLPIAPNQQLSRLTTEAATLRLESRYPESVERYRDALELWTRYREPSEPVALDLAGGLSAALRESGEVDEALRVAREALAHDKTNSANHERVTLRWQLALALLAKGDDQGFLREARIAEAQSKKVTMDFAGDMAALRDKIQARIRDVSAEPSSAGEAPAPQVDSETSTKVDSETGRKPAPEPGADGDPAPESQAPTTPNQGSR